MPKYIPLYIPLSVGSVIIGRRGSSRHIPWFSSLGVEFRALGLHVREKKAS